MLLKTVLFCLLATAVHARHLDFLKEPLIQICNTNSAAVNADRVRVIFDEFTELYPKMMHLEQVPTEFDESRRIGTVDEVSRKFCGKAAQTKFGMTKIKYAADLCTKGDQEILPVGIIIDVLNRIIDYTCYEKDNKTRLAEFVDDGGIRCFNTKPKYFSRCVKITRAGMRTDIENMLRCMIEELKACSAPAALQAQGLLGYIRDNRPSNENNQI